MAIEIGECKGCRKRNMLYRVKSNITGNIVGLCCECFIKVGGRIK